MGPEWIQACTGVALRFLLVSPSGGNTIFGNPGLGRKANKRPSAAHSCLSFVHRLHHAAGEREKPGMPFHRLESMVVAPANGQVAPATNHTCRHVKTPMFVLLQGCWLPLRAQPRKAKKSRNTKPQNKSKKHLLPKCMASGRPQCCGRSSTRFQREQHCWHRRAGASQLESRQAWHVPTSSPP